jgi:hypothetical protein
MLRHQLAIAERDRPKARTRLTWPDRAWLALPAGTVPAGSLAGMRLLVTPGAIRAVPPGRAGRLRRGEAAGLTRAAVDLDAGTLTASGQLQQFGDRLSVAPQKSDAGRQVVAQDRTTIAALREHHLRQRAERAAAGTRWTETGNMFTTPTLAY